MDAMTQIRRVALALGSGGARGYAHIGAINVLAERGFEVVTIAGSSMGAVIGGLAAAGRLEEFTDWVVTLSQRDVLRLLDPAPLAAPGAIRAERVMGKVAEFLDGVQIEDLPVPFTAVATDLDNRREVWFQSGPVATAMRASIGIPGAITPIVVHGRTLVDGGVLNPVPIEPTTAVDSDLTVAVSLSGWKRPQGQHDTPVRESSAPRPGEEWFERVREAAVDLLDASPLRSIAQRLGPGRELEAQRATGDLGLYAVTSRSIDAMSSIITRFRMAANPPDVLVSVPFNVAGAWEFHRAGELIELGRTLTEQALNAAEIASPPPRSEATGEADRPGTNRPEA